jgi:hypothetical protein
MRVVDEENRLLELRRLGLSRPVLRLAAGEVRLEPFSSFRVPYKVYHGMTWEDGPVFVPLWEDGDETTAVRRKGKGLEFFAFTVEAPTKPWPLARTEQGLLATLFRVPLNQWYDDPNESGARGHRALAAAARAIDFRFFPQADRVFREKFARGYEAVRRAYRKLVREIDQGLVTEK